MIAAEVVDGIRRAIANPAEYAKGKRKLELRATFDIFWSQIFTSIFNEEPQSRMNARRRLNAAKKARYDQKQWSTIVKLRKAIAVSENTLNKKSYSDHGDSVAAFISGELSELLEVVSE